MILLLKSCGILDDGDATETFTYRIINETGTTVIISVGNIVQEVLNDSFFECSYSETSNLGLCSGTLKIVFIDTGKGYNCNATIDEQNGLCFVDDERVFVPSNGEDGIFEETSTHIYQYTLTSDLLDNTFELPD